MSNGINDYLKKLIDKSKLNKIFADEDTEISLLLDLYTAEYQGARIKLVHDDKEVQLDTNNMTMVVYEDGKSITKLDRLVALALDYEVVHKFNIYKLDEDYFDDLEDAIEADIIDFYNLEAEKAEAKLIDKLSEFHESDYDQHLIRDEFRRFTVNEKKDYLVLVYEKNGISIKYNTAKNKFTIKSVASYKNKFSPEDVIKDFDNYKFNDVVRTLNHKDNYNKRRSELDDGMAESYPSLGGYSYFTDGDLVD